MLPANNYEQYKHKYNSDSKITFFVTVIVNVIGDWDEKASYFDAKLTERSEAQPWACKKKMTENPDGSLWKQFYKTVLCHIFKRISIQCYVVLFKP